MRDSQINNFNKGINQDVDPLYQPEGTARHILNFSLVSEEGNIFSLTNEEGSKLLETSFPDGFKPIGYCVLNRDIIVALAHPDGYSQIGIIDYQGNYVRKCPSTDGGFTEIQANNNSELGLSLDYPVDMEARTYITGDRLVYFVDNHVPFGYLNLDNPPQINNIAKEAKLLLEYNIPDIVFNGFNEEIGNINIGVYQFAIQYRNEDGSYTNLSIPSNIIPVVDDFRSEGATQYDGDYQDYETVNKSINLILDGLDTNYEFFRLIAITYTEEANQLIAYSLPETQINSERQNITFTGDLEGAVEILPEELRRINISYDTAKCIAQKDNILFLSNLRDSKVEYNSELQKIANSITVGYRIEEHPYFLESENYGFTLNGAYPIDETHLAIAMNKDIDLDNSNTLFDFTLRDVSLPATASITITDYTLVTGDTFTVNGNVIEEGVDFTAETSNDVTANNLTAAIDALSNFTTYTENNVVNIVSETVGTVGNSYTLTTSDNGTSGATLSGFSGGHDQTTYTPTTIEYYNDGSSDIENILYLTFDSAVNTSPLQGIQTDWSILIDNIQSLGGELYDSDNNYVDIVSDPVANLNVEENTFLPGYKNENFTFAKRTYLRGETYSLGFGVVWNTGAESNVFHICGNNTSATSTTNATRDAVIGSGYEGETYGTLGTYVSDLDYPKGQSYPGSDTEYENTITGKNDPVNNKIRHHVMPDTNIEPHFRKNSDGTVYIRLIKLEFTFNQKMSQALSDQCQEIFFSRERRNSDDNKSIYCQGIVKSVYTSPFEFGGDNVSEVHRQPDALYGNVQFNNDNLRGDQVAKYSFDRQANFASLFSPELYFNKLNPSDLEGTTIKPILSLRGQYNPIDLRPWKYYKPAAALSYNEKLYLRSPHVVKGIVEYQIEAFSFTAEEFTIDTGRLVRQGERFDIPNVTENVSAITNRPWSFFELSGDLVPETFGDALEIDFRYPYIFDEVGSITALTQGEYEAGNIVVPTGQIGTALYRVQRNNTSQYGSIGNAEHILIHKSDDIPSIGGTSLYSDVFGGDIFITKFSYTHNTLWRFLPAVFGANFFTGRAEVKSYSEGNYQESHGSDVGDSEVLPIGTDPNLRGVDLRHIETFFVESEINCEYRHQYIERDEEGNPTGNTGPSYYPKEDADNVLGKDQYYVNNANSYNTLYSYENNIKTYRTRSALTTSVVGFENRTIFSQKANEDDAFDAYRIFPQNNFHDIPKNTGEIWDSFVYNNTLYLHTPKSLWKTFVNPNVIIPARNTTELVLGTSGNVFQRPSIEVFTADGGYGGTISQFAGTPTPYGYVFPDALQGKIFLLRGDRLQPITQGLSRYFSERLNTGLVDQLQYTDNPYNGYGIIGVFDFDKDRFIMTKKANESISYSYSFLNKSWVSEHSYIPDMYIAKNNDVYVIKDGNVYEMFVELDENSNASFNNYLGENYPSSIEFVINKGAIISKVFDNIFVNSYTEDIVNNIFDYFTFFTSIQCWNNEFNTDEVVIECSENANRHTYVYGNRDAVVAKFANSEYRLPVPKDAVVSNNQNIYNSSNLSSSTLYRGRITGKYMRVRFVFDNPENRKFVLQNINTIFRKYSG